MAKKDNGLINHVAAVRCGVTGTGNLRLFLRSFDDVINQTLVPIEMEALAYKMPTQLSNFKAQGVQIEFRTTAIDETFNIHSIIAYVKPVATSYPQ